MGDVMVAGVEPVLSPEEQWRRWVKRYTRHLDQLPGLFEAMRSDVLPIGAVRYDRDRVDMSRDGVPVPFRVEVVDAIDDLWAALVQYSENVAQLLEADLPRVSVWRVGSEVAGVSSSADVRSDAYALIAWLIERADVILPLQELDDPQEYLFALIRSNARRFMSPVPERGRRCKVCGAAQVRVSWSDRGEVARCERCQDTVLLEVPRPRSESCSLGAHVGCGWAECLCSCHVARSSSLFTARVAVRAVVVPVVAPMSVACDHGEWVPYRGDDGLRHCGGCGAALVANHTNGSQ